MQTGGGVMVYQDFFTFLILLAVAVVVTAAKVLLMRTRPRPLELGGDLVLGYVGAWLGSPVFGRWFGGISYQNVFIIPALLGAVAVLVMKTAYHARHAEEHG
jgi:uncharacterized membrane protein YeaQ/YmgE (transglycosylase-associated protein family)